MVAFGAPFLGKGVAVGEGVSLGVGVGVALGEGVSSGVGDSVGVGVGEAFFFFRRGVSSGSGVGDAFLCFRLGVSDGSGVGDDFFRLGVAVGSSVGLFFAVECERLCFRAGVGVGVEKNFLIFSPNDSSSLACDRFDRLREQRHENENAAQSFHNTHRPQNSSRWIELSELDVSLAA